MGTAEALPTSSCLIPPFFLPFHSPSLTRRHLPSVVGMGSWTPRVAVDLRGYWTTSFLPGMGMKPRTCQWHFTSPCQAPLLERQILATAAVVERALTLELRLGLESQLCHSWL